MACKVLDLREINRSLKSVRDMIAPNRGSFPLENKDWKQTDREQPGSLCFTKSVLRPHMQQNCEKPKAVR